MNQPPKKNRLSPAAAAASSAASAKKYRYHEGMTPGGNTNSYPFILPKTIIKHIKFVQPLDSITGPGSIRFAGTTAWNEIIRYEMETCSESKP
jgi:hypothetical protein